MDLKNTKPKPITDPKTSTAQRTAERALQNLRAKKEEEKKKNMIKGGKRTTFTNIKDHNFKPLLWDMTQQLRPKTQQHSQRRGGGRAKGAKGEQKLMGTKTMVGQKGEVFRELWGCAVRVHSCVGFHYSFVGCTTV